jgi:hypothetical protein
MERSQPKGHETTEVELFRYVVASLDQEEIFHVLGFEFLQRYNLVRIQNKLAKIRESIHADLGQSCDEKNLNDVLNEYSMYCENQHIYRRVQRLIRCRSSN